MREIKFRGKHKNPYGDKWVYGYYAMKDGRHVIVMPHADAYISSLNERKPISAISVEHIIDVNTLGQYTGLKDKNGKEIYEGDVVLVDNIDFAQIIYDEDRMAYGIKPINDFYFDSPLLADNVALELQVIGNIHDNPELLVKGK